MSSASHSVDVTVAGARHRVHDGIRVDDSQTSPIDSYLDTGVDPFEGSFTEAELHDARRRQSRASSRQAAAHRRKQIQQVLGGLSVVSLILMVMGVVSLMTAMLAPIALGVFFVLSRKQANQSAQIENRVRKHEDSRARNRRSSSGEKSRDSRGERSRQRRSEGARRARANRHGKASRHLDQPAAVAEQQELAATGTDDVRVMSTDEATRHNVNRSTEPGWSPVDAPLPQYINSDRATNFPRNLDSSTKGDWTSERMLEQAEALRSMDVDAEAELGLEQFVDLPSRSTDGENLHEYRRAAND